MLPYLTAQTSFSWSGILFNQTLVDDGIRNIRIAFTSTSKLHELLEKVKFFPSQIHLSLSLGGRVTHFAIGFLLCTPLLNMITYSALQTLGLAAPTHALQFKNAEAPLLTYKLELAMQNASSLSPYQETIGSNIEKLRDVIEHCTACTEGKSRGFWVGIWVDQNGRIQALDGHDVQRKWLLPDHEKNINKLYLLQYQMKASNWDPLKGPAFIEPTGRGYTPPPNEIKNFYQLFLQALNLLARKCFVFAQKENLAPQYFAQPWFIVFISQSQYPTHQLLASF